LSGIPLPPGHRREVWRHRPTGEEFAVQVNEATGQVQLAIERSPRATHLSGGKFGIDTGKLLPGWLDARRGDCEILPYVVRVGEIAAAAGDEVTLQFEDGDELSVRVSEVSGLDPARVAPGIPVVAVQIGDRPPAYGRDTRMKGERFPYPRR